MEPRSRHSMHLEARDIVLGVGVYTTIGPWAAGSSVLLRRCIERGAFTVVDSLTRRRSGCGGTARCAGTAGTRLAVRRTGLPDTTGMRTDRTAMDIRGEDHTRRGKQQARADG